jgi:putative ABC transport system substrate-binding protein
VNENQNIAIEYRWAEGQYDRLPAMAADLVRRQVTVIFATPGVSALAAKAATATIPIIFTSGIDPVRFGLVASLNRPGGNLTGTSNLAVELGPKRLELLHQLVPAVTVIALLDNPSNPADVGGAPYQAAARSLGLQVTVLQARSEQDFEAAFASLVQQRAGALLLSPDPYLTSRSDQLVALAARHAVPTMFTDRQYVAAGGLASYGASVADIAYLAAIYAGRILKGEKASDLPIQQSTKVEFAINLKTAKTLGLTIPQSLLFGADEVIE